MTGARVIDDFSAALTRVAVPDSGAAAVLLADHLSLAGYGVQTGELDPWRAMKAAVRASAADSDDVHWGSLVHPGAIIWPTVLEVGLALRASGPEIARAASVGYEAMVRLAMVLASGATRGFHLTSLVGGVGAAAAASALLEVTVSVDALGHALSVAGGSSGALVERSGTRSFHRGHAVLSGVAGALLAREGLTGSRGDLERGVGAFPPWSRSTADTLSSDLDALASSSVRPLPTSGWNHPAYEAALEAGRAALGPILRITVAVPERTRLASASTFQTPGEAWHHLGHSVAHAVASTAQDQTISELVTLVQVVDRSEPGAEVTLETSDGTSSAEVITPLGHPLRPVNLSDLARKWGMSVTEVSAHVSRIQGWLSNPDPRDPAQLSAILPPRATITSKE